MSSVTLKINGQPYALDVPSDMPLLWALRDKLNLIGTKYSCGIGVCANAVLRDACDQHGGHGHHDDRRTRSRGPTSGPAGLE